MKKIYFDNAASTPINSLVAEETMIYMRDHYGNPSSVHSFGKGAKVLLEETRDLIAGFINCKPKEIFFTSGGTESNNFAIKGTFFRNFNSGKNHIITSSIEHSAVLETVKYLNERFGVEVTHVMPDKNGIIHAEDVLKEIKENTLLISIMHANNEVGSLNDIKAIVEGAKKHNSGKGIYVHTDTVQSMGKIKVDVKDLGVNYATLSAHKIYGPKGIGILYVSEDTQVDKFIHGGKQERNMRGGTENIPAIAGLRKAVEILKESMNDDIAHYKSLKNKLITDVKNIYGDCVIINSPVDCNCITNIVNMSFDWKRCKVDPDMLIINLDLKGIAVSGGSACTSGSAQPSHVLRNLGHDTNTAFSSMRVSFGRENTEEEIDYLMECLKEIVQLKNEKVDA